MVSLILPLLFLAPQKPNFAGYRLVWSDEFNRDGAPDPENWSCEHGFVRNEELQWYQPANATVKGGRLVIEGRRERVANPNYDPTSHDWRKNREFADYTSACLETKGHHQWKYGQFVVRAKISAQKGLWPAIWTLGSGRPWPTCGEVDMLEFYQNSILANTAYGEGRSIWHTVKTPYPQIATRTDWDKKFHVWRMDWDPDWIRLYLDDRLLNETDLSKTVNPDGYNAFHEPQYLLLNLSIGSTGGDPSGTAFPTQYEIDYVRVYQRGAAGG
jgi:beta-glucanase (GH16 family)